MTVRTFRWDDAGAPALSHAAGAIPALLKACLVNGYNSQTVTSVTRSGAVATVQKTAHGFRNGARIVHAGAIEPEYNVDAAITVVDANTYTYPVSGTPATPATGTITAKVAAAGWSNPFSGTNVEVFRNGAGSTQLNLRVAQTATGAARVVGYETMSDVNTGTNAFPTEAQIAGGLYLVGSSTLDSTARPWLIVADEKRCYLWVGASLTTAQGFGSTTNQPMYFFGDILTNKVGDLYHYKIIAGATAATNGVSFGAVTTNLSSTSGGHYVARNYAQTAGAVPSAHSTNGSLSSGGATMGTSGVTYPDPVTGGMTLADVYATESSIVRGRMPGLWAPLHNLPGNPGDTFSGRGAMAGKTFILLDAGNGGTRSRVALETSDTW
ncbi:hypothetical protein [Aromatoleum toluclasticum]|uniref:hypothetical protein n=1 Tax=Aromatoleum toluclasticum TaxID=92003 RepID=UPI0003610909|nr:hypothetical protein [Aromatoleum toluclasticum]